MKVEMCLDGLISEYRVLVDQAAIETHSNEELVNSLIHNLQKEADWSSGGAEALLELAQDYGAFMLRNALALALTLEIEDGRKAF